MFGKDNFILNETNSNYAKYIIGTNDMTIDDISKRINDIKKKCCIKNQNVSKYSLVTCETLKYKINCYVF